LFSGVVQWGRTVGSFSGVVQWGRSVGSYSGVVQWGRSVGSFSGVAQRGAHEPWCAGALQRTVGVGRASRAGARVAGGKRASVGSPRSATNVTWSNRRLEYFRAIRNVYIVYLLLPRNTVLQALPAQAAAEHRPRWAGWHGSTGGPEALSCAAAGCSHRRPNTTRGPLPGIASCLPMQA